MTTPREAALQWATQHPTAQKLLRVIVDRTDKRSTKLWTDAYFYCSAGVAQPLTKRQCLAYPYQLLSAETLDLRTPPPAPQPFHVLYWNCLGRASLTAACPVCGAPQLEVRRDSSGRTFVLHCNSVQPVLMRGAPVALSFLSSK